MRRQLHVSELAIIITEKCMNKCDTECVYTQHTNHIRSWRRDGSLEVAIISGTCVRLITHVASGVRALCVHILCLNSLICFFCLNKVHHIDVISLVFLLNFVSGTSGFFFVGQARAVYENLFLHTLRI